MKKVGVVLLSILCISLIACGDVAQNDSGNEELIPVQSYGNQMIQEYQRLLEESFFIDGDWVYGTKDNRLIKFKLDDPKKQTVLYEDETRLTSRITVSGDWVYFILSKSDDTFCRIKTDGSEMTELTKAVFEYVVTEKDIYYSLTNNNIEKAKIYVMDLDGNNQRKILYTGAWVQGIDDGWIYYYKNIDTDYFDDYYDAYRSNLDDVEDENVFDLHEEMEYLGLISGGQMYYFNHRYIDDDTPVSDLTKKLWMDIKRYWIRSRENMILLC